MADPTPTPSPVNPQDFIDSQNRGRYTFTTGKDGHMYRHDSATGKTEDTGVAVQGTNEETPWLDAHGNRIGSIINGVPHAYPGTNTAASNNPQIVGTTTGLPSGYMWSRDGEGAPQVVPVPQTPEEKAAADLAKQREAREAAAAGDSSARGWAQLDLSRQGQQQTNQQQQYANLFNLTKYMGDTAYEYGVKLPMDVATDQRAADQARSSQAAQAGSYETSRFNAARGMGQDYVDQLVKLIPTQVSPAFLADFARNDAAARAGQVHQLSYRPEDLTIPAPDLRGAYTGGIADARAQLPDWQTVYNQAPRAPMANIDIESLVRSLPFGASATGQPLTTYR